MNMMLGYNISNALKKNKVSLSELGKRLNCHRQTIALRINEPWRLTIGEVIKIGAAIGVDWHELLEGVE